MDSGTNDETLYLELPRAVETRLIEVTVIEGISVEDFILDALIEKVASTRRFLGPAVRIMRRAPRRVFRRRRHTR